MSTGLELADLENPVSIWKPVPKGYRSALRRSREFDKISKDADDKNGVVVDALPLKKRRFMSPSNSPPSITQSQETESEIGRKQRRRSTHNKSKKKLAAKEKFTKFDYSEDFSGIEILAAAACDDIIDDVEDVTREGVDSSASAVLFEENAASTKSQDKKETSSQPNRLHWDLNTLMDAWERPLQDDSPRHVVDSDLMVGSGDPEVDDKCKETSIGNVCDAKSSSQSPTEEACVTPSTSEENRDFQLSDRALRPCGEINSSDIKSDSILCAEKVKHEQSNGLAFREEDNKANCETRCSISSEAKASGLDKDRQCAQNMHESVCSEHEKQAGSFGSALESQSMVSSIAKQPSNQVSLIEARSDSENAKVEKMMDKGCVESVDNPREGLSKVIHDTSDESYESGVYQDDKIRNFGRTNSAELQAGHDSQIEDGELRESGMQCHWDENDDENREDELLDYGSESDDERNCSIDKAKDQRIETCGTSDTAKDESDSPKTRTSDLTTDKDFLNEGVGSKTSNKEDGCNLMHGKDSMMRKRFNFGESTYSRDGLGSDKDTHTHARSPGGWDSERRYSNSYFGGYANGSRGMRTMEDHGYAPYDREIGTRRFARFDNQDRRQFVNHPSHRRLDHSSGTRSASNCVNRLYVRDNSPTSNSFRRSSQDRGAFYKSALEDGSAYPNRLAHRLGMPRRERSISPSSRVTRGFARYDNHVREPFISRSLNSRYEHSNGTRSSANGMSRLHVRDRDTSPTSSSYRRSPDRGGFYKSVMEDNPAYSNRLPHRMDMPRRERSVSPDGRVTRGFTRFNHVREQFVNRSSSSRFEHSNGTRSSANGMNRFYARDASPTSNSFRRSPQVFDRNDRGGFYKSSLEGMPKRDRSISPARRGRSCRSESRSRGRILYISGGEQTEDSRLRSRSPDLKTDSRTDRVKMPFQKRFTVGSEDDFTSQKESCIHPQAAFNDQSAAA